MHGQGGSGRPDPSNAPTHEPWDPWMDGWMDGARFAMTIVDTLASGTHTLSADAGLGRAGPAAAAAAQCLAGM